MVENINIDNIYNPIEVDRDFFLEHEEEEQNFYQRAKQLPDSIVNLLFGEDTPGIIKSFAQTFQLQLKQIASLSRLIRQLLVADSYLGNIVPDLVQKLGLEEKKASDLAKAIISQLLTPALPELKNLHLSKFGQPKPQEEKPANPSLPSVNPIRNSPPHRPLENANAEVIPGKVNPNNIVDLRNK